MLLRLNAGFDSLDLATKSRRLAAAIHGVHQVRTFLKYRNHKRVGLAALLLGDRQRPAHGLICFPALADANVEARDLAEIFNHLRLGIQFDFYFQVAYLFAPVFCQRAFRTHEERIHPAQYNYGDNEFYSEDFPPIHAVHNGASLIEGWIISHMRLTPLAMAGTILTTSIYFSLLH